MDVFHPDPRSLIDCPRGPGAGLARAIEGARIDARVSESLWSIIVIPIN